MEGHEKIESTEERRIPTLHMKIMNESDKCQQRGDGRMESQGMNCCLSPNTEAREKRGELFWS